MPTLWAILNGGLSTRFGSPKYLAQRNGETFLEIAQKRILEVSNSADLLVVSGGVAHDTGWSHVVDSAEFSGPLAGLNSLFQLGLAQNSEVLVIQPIDMPLIRSGDLLSLREGALRSQGLIVAQSEASGDQHWVLAAVHRSLFREAIAHIETGTCRSLRNLWSNADCEFLNFPDELLVNVNHPQDLPTSDF